MSFRPILFEEGNRDIAQPIRNHRAFTSGGGPFPTYSDAVAREAAQVAERFCNNTLTPFDRKENLFSFNRETTEQSIQSHWLRQSDTSRFWQVWMGNGRGGTNLPKAEIGCAEANCRGNKVLICRPNSPKNSPPSGVSDFDGFVEPKAETDARGCEIKPAFVKKTRKMYEDSLFYVEVREAMTKWLDALNNTLIQAENRLDLGEKPQIRVHQIRAPRNPKIPEAFIAELTDADRAAFMKEALRLGYDMYFPNGPNQGTQALTQNETWLLARKTLDKVPLITQEGLKLIPGNMRVVNTFFFVE